MKCIIGSNLRILNIWFLEVFSGWLNTLEIIILAMSKVNIPFKLYINLKLNIVL